MSSKFVNVEFSERLLRAFKLLPAYVYLTDVSVNKVQSFAETLLDLSSISVEKPLGISSLNGDQAPMQPCIKFASYRAMMLLLVVDIFEPKVST